ncbi:MAG: tetratricopeptide repeat protein [Polyangiaceae bacterium]|nr:tetratricopeptide repeat protein [Polyangiaceae bacterium]
MSKRLAFLEKLVADGKADSFGHYCYALELKNVGRVDDALAAFDTLRGKDERYVPMYLMCGSMLLDASRPAEARVWLEQGVQIASSAGDAKALGEIRDALSRCEP